MKNLVKIFAVALLGIAAAACNEKEIAPETPATTPEEVAVPEVITFTATISNASVKGYDAQGKVKWEIGDIIRIAANTECPTWETHSGISLDSYSKVVTLSSDNISADGKTASFSVAGLPTDAASYYAVAHTGGVPYPNFNNTTNVDKIVASIMQNSDFECQIPNSTSNGIFPHVSCASCTASNTKLEFKNVGTILKFSTRRNDICHVDFYGNTVNPSTHWIHKISTNTRGYSWTNANQVCFLGESNTTKGDPGDYYILLAPGQTFTGGFTLYAFPDWKGRDNGGLDVLIGKVVINSDFVTKAGDFWDLGYIEDHFHYDTYKEAYDAGQTIKVGNLNVNKATYGASQLITSDARFYPVSGVAFIDPSASGANLQYWSGTSKCIIIGNDPAQRSNLEIRATGNFQDGQVVAFKNLNVTYSSSTMPLMSKTADGNNIDWFAIDNCKWDFHTRLVELPTCGIKNFSVTNSDIIVCDDSGPYDLHRSLICRGTESDHSGQTLVFRNNLVTTESATARTFNLISTSDNKVKLSFNTVDVSQNTIFNVNAYHFLNLGNIVNTFTMTKNLIYDGGSWSFGYLHNIASADKTVDVSGATNNKLTGYVLRCNDGVDLVGTSVAGWYDKSTYPFSQGDNATVISTRDYTPIATLSGYGVTNPKRLQ